MVDISDCYRAVTSFLFKVPLGSTESFWLFLSVLFNRRAFLSVLGNLYALQLKAQKARLAKKASLSVSVQEKQNAVFIWLASTTDSEEN